MSKGKYSPYNDNKKREFKYNCYGAKPTTQSSNDLEYDERNMFANYDHEGFDSYGYSAFDGSGNYVGHGQGIDRLGYTEYEYLSMDDEEFNDVCDLQRSKY